MLVDVLVYVLMTMPGVQYCPVLVDVARRPQQKYAGTRLVLQSVPKGHCTQNAAPVADKSQITLCLLLQHCTVE